VKNSTNVYARFEIGFFKRHNDKQIHIAVGAGGPTRIGTEQHDLIRMEILYNPADHFLDFLLRFLRGHRDKIVQQSLGGRLHAIRRRRRQRLLRRERDVLSGVIIAPDSFFYGTVEFLPQCAALRQIEFPIIRELIWLNEIPIIGESDTV
jgi:hypothetical protein